MPYRALSIAVRNEERAFAFWSYVAAFMADPEMKTAAEAMAREELSHVAILRKERRRAYHSEHDRAGENGGAPGVRIDASVLESRLATRLAEVEARLQCGSRDRAHELHEEAVKMSARAAGFGSFPAALQEADSQAMAEALIDAYLEGAERSGDPARLESLQALAECAIARLAWLRSLNKAA